jgi:hypothetical protein
MATCTLQEVFDSARSYLSDTQVPGGEVFTNTYLQLQFEEPYRNAFRKMQGLSKRVQKVAYVNLPASTTVLIPSTYGIVDFAEPESIEERPAANVIAISTTSNTTPITVTTAAPHGLGSTGDVVEGTISGVAGSSAPWGQWFATITGASTFTLNGSARGGAAGTGGAWTPWSQLAFREVGPLDYEAQGLDGVPQQYLGKYIWRNSRLHFRGAMGVQQLRIMYWASGSAPQLANQDIGIDDVRDFLACATAANAARSKGWFDMASDLRVSAYGDPRKFDEAGGLLGEFVKAQVLTAQRGPQRRARAFRQHKTPYDASPIW